MNKNEKILRLVDANLRLEGMCLTSAEKRIITNCLIGKSSFDKEIKKLSTRYRGGVA